MLTKILSTAKGAAEAETGIFFTRSVHARHTYFCFSSFSISANCCCSSLQSTINLELTVGWPPSQRR